MRLITLLIVLAACAAPRAWADKKLDEAVAKAEAQLTRGKPDEAVKILQKAAAQAAKDPEASLALGRLYARLGRLDEAGTAWAKAGDLAAAAAPAVRARVWASQSAFALRAGTVADALSLARRAVEAAAGPESLAALATAQARQGDPAARDTAARAVQAAAENAHTQRALGASLLAARLGAEAETAYRRAQKLDGGSAAAGIGLALALAEQGQSAPALEAARAAVKADAHSAEAQAAVGLASLVEDPGDKKGEAIAALQQATFMEPKNALVRWGLGRVFESRGQLDEAAAAYTQAAQQDPSWSRPQVAALGVKLAKGTNATAVLDELRALPEEVRASGEAGLLRGRLLSQKEEWPEALAALDAAAAALPGSAEAHALRGQAAGNAGELKTAADAYGRASELRPGDAAYAAAHGTYLGYDGRHEEGLAVLQKLTERPEGASADILTKLGEAYRGFRPPRVAEAVAAYEKILKLDPKNGAAALGIAQSYRAGKQWPRAISAYERVEQSHPRLKGEALLGTAWCHYRAGDESKARFYTGLAASAGADVTGIRQALTRPTAADDLTELGERLRSKSAAAQARAVQGLLEMGPAGVPALTEALGRKSTAIAVKERAIAALGTLGPAAKEALPPLDRLAKDGDARLAAAAQAASERIRGRQP